MVCRASSIAGRYLDAATDLLTTTISVDLSRTYSMQYIEIKYIEIKVQINEEY